MLAYDFFFQLPTFYTEMLQYIVPPSQTGRVYLIKVYGKKLYLKIWYVAELYLVAKKKKSFHIFLSLQSIEKCLHCKRLRHWKMSVFYIFKVVMLRETLVVLCSLLCHFAPIWSTVGMMICSE